MNERQPYGDMRKSALLAREKIARHERLLSETDQLLRDSRDLIGRSQELIRESQHLNETGVWKVFVAYSSLVS
jgi:hypothetical protein